jgi:hypothetical protein
VTYVTAPANVPGNSLVTPVTASCPAGTIVIGGGATVGNQSYEQVNDSYPNGQAGWTADIFNGDSGSDSATVTAICAPAAATAT